MILYSNSLRITPSQESKGFGDDIQLHSYSSIENVESYYNSATSAWVMALYNHYW